MVVGRVTNEGRRSEQAMRWSGEAHGLDDFGGSPSFFVAFLTTAYNFTAISDGPHPGHVTCALIRASVSGSDPIMATSRYSSNNILMSATRFLSSIDTTNNLSMIQFAPGFDPLVLVTDPAGLANVGGFIICNQNTMVATTKVYAIFPGTGSLASVPVNNSIRLRSLTMFSQPV